MSARKRPRQCDLCRNPARPGYRYCNHCISVVKRKMWLDGYFTELPGKRRAGDDAAEDTSCVRPKGSYGIVRKFRVDHG